MNKKECTVPFPSSYRVLRRWLEEDKKKREMTEEDVLYKKKRWKKLHIKKSQNFKTPGPSIHKKKTEKKKKKKTPNLALDLIYVGSS